MTRRSFTTVAAALATTLSLPLPAWGGDKAPLQPGMEAPAFRLRGLDGTMVRLDELAYPGKEKSYAKKRPLFLDFFRTDCSPCLRAMPDLVKLHEGHAAKGVEVILVALLEENDGRATLERYLAEQKLPFRVVVDEAEHFAKKYLGDPVTLPATFLIDDNGIVKKAKYGASGSFEEHFGAELRAVLEARAKPASK
ncbi:TlpA family protein disulfide reductase [Myxococcota bacterium]|nr:TlpA family protein disulfide reductase [Myxococcota bacterium]